MSAGYAFVPFPDRVERSDRQHAVWHRRCPGTLAGTLHVTLRTEQDVHVGSGRKRLQGDDLLRAAVRVRGRPGVPGSTLKGVLRSRYEAITRSCAPVKPGERPVPSESRSRPDVKHARLTQSALALQVFDTCRPGRDMCPACALFGRMSQRGRVAVGDFVCEGDVAFSTAALHEQFLPRLHHVGEATVGTSGGKPCFEVERLHGRKFAVGMGPVADSDNLQRIEVIPAGSTLRGSLRLFNVTPAELGGLVSALGHGTGGQPPSALKVGAGKGRGLGRARVHGLQFVLRDASGRLDEVGQATVDAWLAEFARSPDRFAEGERRLHEIHQREC